jgi:hypothetical protein
MKERIAILAILAALWPAWPAAAAAPTVSLGNGVLEVPVGQIAPLPVSVADVQNLYGVEIHLRFDPAVVEVADADPGADGVQVVSGDFLSADFVAQNRADNQAGTVDYAVTQINPSEPKSGSGTLLTIRFQGVGAGRTSQLEVLDKVLTTRDGEVISATATAGQIRVKGLVAGENTSTPLPETTRSATATPESPAGDDAPATTQAFTSSLGPRPRRPRPASAHGSGACCVVGDPGGTTCCRGRNRAARMLATGTLAARRRRRCAAPSVSGALPGSTAETASARPAPTRRGGEIVVGQRRSDPGAGRLEQPAPANNNTSAQTAGLYGL